MALIACPECGNDVSDKAPTCPRCGVPLTVESPPPAPSRAQRRMGLLVGICLGAVIVLAGAGYTAWAWAAAEAHNNAWADQTETISKSTSSSSTVTVAGDQTAVTFASHGTSTCTPDEEQTFYIQVLDLLVKQGLGDSPASITDPIARQAAAKACSDQKKADFATSISDTQVNLASFLVAVHAPESVASATDGLRGLDGTQSQTFYSPMVGEVTMQARYDGSNGLYVTLTRERQSFDWGVLFGR